MSLYICITKPYSISNYKKKESYLIYRVNLFYSHPIALFFPFIWITIFYFPTIFVFILNSNIASVYWFVSAWLLCLLVCMFARKGGVVTQRVCVKPAGLSLLRVYILNVTNVCRGWSPCMQSTTLWAAGHCRS